MSGSDPKKRSIEKRRASRRSGRRRGRGASTNGASRTGQRQAGGGGDDGYRRYGLVFLGYGILCVVTAVVFEGSRGEILSGSFTESGAEIGPIDAPKDNSVYEVQVSQALKLPSSSSEVWSSIDADVLDEQRQVLFGFGDGLWSAAGRDDEGRWSESKTTWDTKLTLPKKGRYYLRFEIEASYQTGAGPVKVTVSRKTGSSLLFYVLGIPSLLAAVALWFRGAAGTWWNPSWFEER